MRNILLFIFMLFLGNQSLFSQSLLTMDFGQNFTNYKYLDNQGVRDSGFNANFSSSLNIGYAYKLKEGVFFTTKIGYREGGATYNYDNFNYRWKLNYAESRLGVGYEYSFGAFGMYFTTEGYAGYLFKAEQRLHNLESDMLANKTVEQWDFGMIFSPGVSYQINEEIKIGLGFNYMLGLHNIEKDKTEETYNTLMGSNIGLQIKL